MKVNVFFSKKAKTHKLNAFPKVKLFVFQMLYPIKKRDDFEKLEELASLQNQVGDLRLHNKFGKQNFHDDMEN